MAGGGISITAEGAANPTAASGVYTVAVTSLGIANFLLVAVSYQNGSNPPTSITYGGAALTEISGTAGTMGATNSGSSIWYLLAPASGANNIVITGNSNTGTVNMSYAGFTGVNTTSPIGASGRAATASGAVSSQSVTLAGVASTKSWLFGCEASFFSGAVNPAVSPAAWQSTGQSVTANGDSRGYYNNAPVAGSNTWTLTSSQAGYLDLQAVEILPAAAAPVAQQVTVASGLAGTFAIGALSLAMSLTAAPSTAAFSQGAATVAQSVIAGPNTATYSQGAATTSQQPPSSSITAGPDTATYSLGAVTINQNVQATPMMAAFTLGSDQVNQNVQASPDPATFRVASDATLVVQSAPSITAGSLTATFAQGSATTSQPATGTINAAPNTATFTLGSVTVIEPQTVNAGPNTAAYSLGAVTIASGNYIVAGPNTAAFSTGAITTAQPTSPTVTASPSTMAASLGAVTTAGQTAPSITAGPNAAAFALGAFTTAGVIGPSITASNVGATFALGAVSVAQSAIIDAGPLTATYSIGGITVAENHTIVAAPLVVAASVGAFTTAEVVAPVVDAATASMTAALGSATVSVAAAPVIGLGTSKATFTTGAFALVETHPIIIDMSPLVFNALLLPVRVTTIEGLVVPAGYLSATFKVALASALTEPASVGWITTDGTAMAGRDYVQSGGAIIFEPGQTYGEFQVLIYPPAPGSPSRNFDVLLSAQVNCVINQRSATCVIAAVPPSGNQDQTQTLAVAPLLMTSALGDATVAEVVISIDAAPVTMIATPGSVTMVTAQLLSLSPVTATYALPGFALAQGQYLITSGVTMTASLGSLTQGASPNQTVTASPLTMTDSLGGVTVTVAATQSVQAGSNTATYSLGAFTTTINTASSSEMGVGEMGVMTMGS